MERQHIVIFGAGYVGFSLGVLLGKYHHTIMIDTNEDKVRDINHKKSPISEFLLEANFTNNKCILPAYTSLDPHVEADWYFIATPTNYNTSTNQFDTSSIDSIVEYLHKTRKNPRIVIKSTIPVGYTKSLIEKYGNNRIMFSPEFLREGNTIHDHLYPSRLIVGHSNNQSDAVELLDLLNDITVNKHSTLFSVGVSEAESIKLFSNAYLATRVAFFNELDSFAENNNLSSREIIECLSSDPRIGDFYNNPSFGYGGYCLPKDTKQLLHHFKETDTIHSIISAMIESNDERAYHIRTSIAKQIALQGNDSNHSIGIYRVNMKTGSDNWRQSAVFNIINGLISDGFKIYLYEPLVEEYVVNNKRHGIEVVDSVEELAEKSSIIIANRMNHELNPYKDKVYTRDVFNRD